MNVTNTFEPDMPEYLSTSIGRPDLRNIANRLRDLAALMASENLEHEANYLLMAYAHIRAKLACEALRDCCGNAA